MLITTLFSLALITIICTLNLANALPFFRTTTLESLIFKGSDLHPSLITQPIDKSSRFFPNGSLPPDNPHISHDAQFIEAVARRGSQARLGNEGVISALYAVYTGKKDLGIIGLEAMTITEAEQREKMLRKIWVKNIKLARAFVTRKNTTIILLWNDGVSEEVWEAVKTRVIKQLNTSVGPGI